MTEEQKILVTCAIIEWNNKVLCAQRSEKMNLPLKWEFPGGKVELGEKIEDCLLREIKEELDIDISIKKRLSNNQHSYIEGVVIVLIPFVCEYKRGTIYLREHSAFKWLQKDELSTLTWAEADVPVLKEYLALQ